MQRSPVIFWLLLAATAAVDAVALSQGLASHSDKWTIVYDALIVGQLSVLSIWSSLRRKKTFWTRISPAVGVLIAAALAGLFGWPPFVEMLPYYGLHVAAILALLWVLRRTSFWHRRTVSNAIWQYSLFELLILMTVAAVLASALRNAEWLSGERWLNLAFVSGSASLAFASTVLWTMPWHWLFRAAGPLAFAILLGAAFMLSLEPLMPLFLTVHYLIQAIELSVWLGLGDVIPRGESNAIETSPEELGPPQT